MLNIFGVNVSYLDAVAFIFFLSCWTCYAVVVDVLQKNRNTLVHKMDKYRLRWVKYMATRDERLVDIRIVAQLMDTTKFFSSTAIFIIAGMFAVLGYSEHAIEMLKQVPFFEHTTEQLWMIKTSLVIIIFVYTFFKCTWVIRQFNYINVLIMSTPHYVKGEGSLAHVKNCARYVRRINHMLTNSGRHFNMVIRSYYFGLVALGWYISPILLIVLSMLVVFILYRREFMSKTLEVIS